MLRYAPFALIWLIGIPFAVWLVLAPSNADPRYWQVDIVDVKLGSTDVFNPAENAKDKTTLKDAAKSNTLPFAPPPKMDGGFSPPPPLPSDGIRIKALNPDLQEDTDHGTLPRAAADGRAPWQYYARPFPPDDKRPRLAIIVKDMGLSAAGVTDGIATLPGTITFAFSPYADDLAKSMQSARDAGHETMLELPLEVPPGSTEDPGTLAVSSTQTTSVNQDNFFKLLSHMPGCVGVITEGGQQLVNNQNMIQPLMQNLSTRGLLMVDDTQQNETLTPLIAEQLKAPWARSLFSIDGTLSQDAMDAAMGKAVEAAKQNGRAVVIAGAEPLTRATIANWARRLDREGVVALAPISAVVTLGSAQAAPQVAPAPAPDNTSQVPAGAPPGNTPANAPNAPNTPGNAPGVMQPPPEVTPPSDDSSITPPDGSMNLLNPKASNGAPAPNLLDPSKSAATPAPPPVPPVSPQANH